MKFQLKKVRIQLYLYIVLWGVVVIFLFLNSEFFWDQSVISVLSVILTFMSAMIMFLFNKENEVSVQINGVRPVWKIIDRDSVEFFSLDRDKSVLDNVRYYSIICDDKHKIKSMNLLVNNGKELKDFFFTYNAVMESDKIYYLTSSPLIGENKNSGEDNKKSLFIDLGTYKEEHPTCKDIKNYKQLNVFKATTIFGDDTYFFEGDGLSGGICTIKKTYEPYSGNWNGVNIKVAESYIKEIQNIINSKKSRKMQ